MATIVADSTSRTHVQAAIDAASSEDTVSIPSGESDWTGNVSVPDAKKLYIVGAGIGSTIINRNSVDASAFALNASGSHLGHLALNQGLVHTWGQDWRVHHCRIDNDTTWGLGVYATGQSTPPVLARGLVDNCDMINARVLAQGTAFLLSENNNQHILWAVPLTLGDAEAVFVEDCAFSGAQLIHAVDNSYGGKYVFRHNTITITRVDGQGYACEAHSLSGNDRAGRSWEIYENHIISNAALGLRCVAFVRGGTGVFFNNTVTGILTFAQAALTMDNKRDTESGGAPSYLCDGTINWDENTTSEAGWHCRDQIGVSGDDSLWAPGNAYDQAFDPVYVWGNTPNTVYLQYPSTPPHIELDRDYFMAERPAYTPYTYPHPLRGEESGEAGFASDLAMILK